MTTELLNGHFDVAANQFLARFTELVMAPVNEPAMVWFAAPLVIATLMMALYFGRYRKEELGWNSAFANTMVFLFVTIDLIRQMYESSVPFTWMNILNSPLYLSLTVALAGFSIFSMIVVYYHLLPKNIAFKLFSDLPVNIALYAIMTVIYAGVPADWNTLVAAVLLFLIAWVCLRILQYLQQLSAKKKHEEDSILVAQEKVADEMMKKKSSRKPVYSEPEDDDPPGDEDQVEEEPSETPRKKARK